MKNVKFVKETVSKEPEIDLLTLKSMLVDLDTKLSTIIANQELKDMIMEQSVSEDEEVSDDKIILEEKGEDE